MSEIEIRDQNKREFALNTDKSFIVQAPAGSGKTSLLVQRYLKLLSKVNNPEEITAITFTKKAAFEMKDRIISSLKNANEGVPKDSYKKTTQTLAKAALKQNESKKWNLIQNPNRLRIQTIDSFCYYIVNSSPIFTQINHNFQIAQNPDLESYYQKAAHEVLKNISDPKYHDYLESLLLHLGNDWERALNLFVVMLKSREQWLPHIIGLENTKELRKKMELALKEVSQENFERAIELFPETLYGELIELLRFSKDNYESPPSFLCESDLEENYSLNCTTLKGAANILLTKEFSWRKKITKEHGFPALDTKHDKAKREFFKIMKKRMEELLKKLHPNKNLRMSLENLLLSPPPNYNNQEWQLIEALLELLPLLAAHLKVIFNENKITDYAEISMEATRALGEEDLPSDFALNLDYRLQHLLIDEFQDTSISHFRLIEKLTAGWQQDDGHTIFIVGDPMQSIYRFREAEVGLFLRVQHEGINNLKLEPITLTTNFRSSQVIIDWINSNFTKIMPMLEDIGLGAVPFKPSTSTLDNPLSSIKFNILNDGDVDHEAYNLISVIEKISQKFPDESIAILVKARSHLKNIISNLKKTNLSYQAFELENLKENLVIRDLTSLTRALFDLSDRIFWLAILRAPWCGLTLEDLHKIANGENEIIWDNILNYESLNLSKDGSLRSEKFITTFKSIISQRGRLNWRELIEKAWLMLGGPATIQDEIELEYADDFFALLNENFNIDQIEKKLESLYTSPKAPPDTKIQIMTIHKAKGLEFDHVIIPGINRSTKASEQKLIMWHERPKLHHSSNLILSPITSAENNKDRVYKYLKSVEQKKTFYETSRLLYVAMTRAKKSITILGNVKETKTKNGSTYKIQSGTLLEQLKPCFSENWILKLKQKEKLETNIEEKPPEISRLNINWKSPIKINMPREEDTFNWKLADNQASIIGTLIHYILCQISKENTKNWDKENINKQENYWRKLLQQMGYIDIDHGIDLLNKAISSTLNDERGKWILAEHKDTASELVLSTMINNKLENYIIDRTFIDENDTRWIIDYKTSQPKKQNIEEFLQQEKAKYTTQLKQYKKIIQGLNQPQKIRLALYFPLFCGWIEI